MILIGLAMQWIVAAATFVAAVGLTLAWFKSGRKALLLGAGAALAVGAVVLVVEAIVVTDEERVEAEVLDVARAVERNDLDAVLDHVHPDAQDLQDDAKLRLQQFEFSSVLVKLQRIEIDQRQMPRTASAHFIVTPSGTHKSSQQPIPRSVKPYLQVEFVEQGDRWLIRSYEVRDFIEAFQKPKQR